MTSKTTVHRVFNFSAGPAVMPVPVLEEIQRDLLALPGVGMSILEISHRSKMFEGDSRAGRSRHSHAGGRSRQLSSAVPAGRGQPPILDGADEPARRGRHRRLHRQRLVGREGDSGGEEGRDGERGGHDEVRPIHARSGTGGAEAHGRRGLRAHDIEQHDRGHAVQAAPRCGRPAARERHLLGDVQPADRCRASRPHLRRRAKEHGTGRPDGRHHPRRSAGAVAEPQGHAARRC